MYWVQEVERHFKQIQSETFQDYALYSISILKMTDIIKKVNGGLISMEEYTFSVKHINSLFVGSYYSGESLK